MKGRWRIKCPCALAWAWLAAGRRARIFWAPPDTVPWKGNAWPHQCKVPAILVGQKDPHLVQPVSADEGIVSLSGESLRTYSGSGKKGKKWSSLGT